MPLNVYVQYYNHVLLVIQERVHVYISVLYITWFLYVLYLHILMSIITISKHTIIILVIAHIII